MIETMGITSLKMVWAGMMLCLGFWACKKLTNRVDQFLFTHSREFRETKRQREPILEAVE
jgi:hypothetical protein